MRKARNYERIAKELELVYYLQGIGTKEAIKHSKISKQDFKYLVIANLLTKKNGLFEIKEIPGALRAGCYAQVAKSVNRMLSYGYIELIKGRKFGSEIGRKYATTGTAIYLIRKYTDAMRRLLKESDNRTDNL